MVLVSVMYEISYCWPEKTSPLTTSVLKSSVLPPLHVEAMVHTSTAVNVWGACKMWNAMTQIQKWLRWCQKHHTALMVMIKLMRALWCIELRDCLHIWTQHFSFSRNHNQMKLLKAKSLKEHGFNWPLSATRELQHWQVLGNVSTECHLYLKNNKSHFPSKTTQSFWVRGIRHNRLIGGRVSPRNQRCSDTNVDFLFPFYGMRTKWLTFLFGLHYFCIFTAIMKVFESHKSFLQPKQLESFQ